MEIRIIDENIHNNYLKDHPQKSFFQSLPMLKRRENNKIKVEYLGFYKDNKLVGTCGFYKRKIILNHFNYETFDGPLLDEDIDILEALKTLKVYTNKVNALKVYINPNLVAYYHNPEILEKIQANDYENLREKIEDLGFIYEDVTFSDQHINWFYKKDLSEFKSYDELFSSFERETRRLITQSKNIPLQIKTLKKEEIPLLMDILKMTADDKNFSIRDLAYYESLYDYFKKYENIEFNVVSLNIKQYLKQLADERDEINTKILADEKIESKRARNRLVQNQDILNGINRKIAAIKEIKAEIIYITAGIFLILDNEIVYLNGGSDLKYHNFYGAYFLQDHMIKKAFDLNVPTYNFYGTRGSFSGRPNEDGVYFFKKGFNGQLIENFGFYIYSPTNFSSKFINTTIKTIRKFV